MMRTTTAAALQVITWTIWLGLHSFSLIETARYYTTGTWLFLSYNYSSLVIVFYVCYSAGQAWCRRFSLSRALTLKPLLLLRYVTLNWPFACLPLATFTYISASYVVELICLKYGAIKWMAPTLGAFVDMRFGRISFYVLGGFVAAVVMYLIKSRRQIKEGLTARNLLLQRDVEEMRTILSDKIEELEGSLSETDQRFFLS